MCLIPVWKLGSLIEERGILVGRGRIASGAIARVPRLENTGRPRPTDSTRLVAASRSRLRPNGGAYSDALGLFTAPIMTGWARASGTAPLLPSPGMVRWRARARLRELTLESDHTGRRPRRFLSAERRVDRGLDLAPQGGTAKDREGEDPRVPGPGARILGRALHGEARSQAVQAPSSSALLIHAEHRPRIGRYSLQVRERGQRHRAPF